MQITADLHSHSGASGGVGDINFDDIYQTMLLKGIDIYGTGDCLFPKWLEFLKSRFSENNGLLTASEYSNKFFLLQTELIFTIPYLQPQENSLFGKMDTGKRKAWHNVVLFPSIKACEKTLKLLEKYQVKNTIGRPFVKTNSLEELEKFLFELKEIDELIEIIPAHIFTPDGAYGSDNPVNSLKDLYGKFLPYIKAVETGLSADPSALMMIPELDNLAFISNSDGHCAALNRLGREYTKLEIGGEEGDIKGIEYINIVEALRNNKIAETVEFNMSEGRYYLTGHRSRPDHPENCFFWPKEVPDKDKCPICGKRLTIGVLDRVYRVSKAQAQEERVLGNVYGYKRKWQTLVPLVEAIATSLNIKSITSTKVTETYSKIVAKTGSENSLWERDEKELTEKLKNDFPSKLVSDILAVKKGDFKFDPPGFDGSYGCLVILT